MRLIAKCWRCDTRGGCPATVGDRLACVTRAPQVDPERRSTPTSPRCASAWYSHSCRFYPQWRVFLGVNPPMSTSDLIARGGWNHPQLIQLCGVCCVDVFLSAGNSVLGPALGSHCLEPQRVSHARSIGLPHDLFRACRQWQSWCAMSTGHHRQGLCCVLELLWQGYPVTGKQWMSANLADGSTVQCITSCAWRRRVHLRPRHHSSAGQGNYGVQPGEWSLYVGPVFERAQRRSHSAGAEAQCWFCCLDICLASLTPTP